MTNWFQISGVSPIYGWGWTKRWIVQGGPIMNAQCTMQDAEQNMRELIKKARESRCVYVEIRCYDDYSAYREAFEKAGFVYQPHYDITIDPSRELPVAKMRQIKRSLEEGYSWREATNEEDVVFWYDKLRRLYWYKIHRPLPSSSFFINLVETKMCKLLIVEKDWRIVGGVLLAVEPDKSKAYEWYICGQVMSTWAAIDWCRQQNVKLFDTMGAGVPDVPYGVRDFKLQMGGELHEWGRYVCVLRPMWYAIGSFFVRLFTKKEKEKK